jgi:hypothetical protein
MILLNKNNVKVLGGDVPQLYAGNMITELETRFKAKLGMIEEPNTPVPAEPSTRSERLVDDIEDFDDDDINYDALDMVESVNVQTNIPEEPIHQFNDDDDFMDALPHISPPRQSMLSLSRKRSIQQTQQQHRSSPPPPPPSQKRNRTDDESSSIEIPKIKPENSMNNTQDDSADLSWVDASVWDNLLANKDDDMELDENGKAHCSFETLLKTLKAMEQGNHTENIADIVTVKVRCIKMAKLRMSSKTGFYLEIVIGDPVDIDMDTVKVIFTNEVRFFHV